MHCRGLHREGPRPRECLAPQRAAHSMRGQCPWDVSPPAVCIFHALLMPSYWWCGPEHHCTLYIYSPVPMLLCLLGRLLVWAGSGLAWIYWIIFVCQCHRLPSQSATVLSVASQRSFKHQQQCSTKAPNSDDLATKCRIMRHGMAWHAVAGLQYNTWMMQA